MSDYSEGLNINTDNIEDYVLTNLTDAKNKLNLAKEALNKLTISEDCEGYDTITSAPEKIDTYITDIDTLYKNCTSLIEGVEEAETANATLLYTSEITSDDTAIALSTLNAEENSNVSETSENSAKNEKTSTGSATGDEARRKGELKALRK